MKRTLPVLIERLPPILPPFYAPHPQEKIKVGRRKMETEEETRGAKKIDYVVEKKEFFSLLKNAGQTDTDTLYRCFLCQIYFPISYLLSQLVSPSSLPLCIIDGGKAASKKCVHRTAVILCKEDS